MRKLPVALICRSSPLFPKFGTCALMHSPRPNTRDVRPIVTTRGAGCDGRKGAQTMRIEADGQVVWSWSPDAGIKLIEMRFRPCGRNAEIDRRRRLESPVLRREREVSRKPLRRECRIVSADLTILCAFLSFQHTSLRVRPAPGIPCALYFLRVVFRDHSGRILPRGCEGVSGIVIASEASNPDLAERRLWIASSLRSSQ